MKNWTYKNFIIHEFDELESTNSHAFELANLQEISDHEIILAHKQKAGRGRQNRSWNSPLGNLYFSLMLRPNLPAEKISELSFVAIVALREMIKKEIKQVAKLTNKWPNDLLIDDKKVAGLLLESKISGKNCEFVILGIGLNIDSNPDNTIFPAANLKDFAINISPESALKDFLDEFEKIYQIWINFGFEGIRKLWLKDAFRLHEKITVKLDGKEIVGVFEDLDAEGNLILKSEDGILKISAADVS